MKKQPKRQVELRKLLVGGLIGLLLTAWVVWSQWDRIRDALARPPVETVAMDPAGEAEESTPDENEALAPDFAERRWVERIGSPPQWPEDLMASADCQTVEGELMRVCRALETGGSREPIDVPGGLCALVSRAAEELAARPPSIGAELKSYATILSNTHHLFRTLGRERLEPLRRAVGNEPELAEPAALALFRWLISRESCARSGRTAIRTESLYEYAGFVFQSLGGQAYLRRRSPRVEALTGFYALLLLDRAAANDHNPHGVDPRPEIRRTRALIEGQSWVFGDRYLELLDEMDRRWNATGGGGE